jgi:hypothetical protein
LLHTLELRQCGSLTDSVRLCSRSTFFIIPWQLFQLLSDATPLLKTAIFDGLSV